MTVIIAEKPSLARNISSAVGGMSRRDGFFEGNGYIVTWAFGHLFTLADIEEYNPRPEGEKHWTLKNLPCFPSEYRFELKKDKNGKQDDGVKKQFETIRALCCRNDTDIIVNAGDSDREGEIIVRLCIEKSLAGNNDQKQIKRLWLPDQTPETITRALCEMKDDSEYDCLANEGFARMYIDWLYGVNLTRYATLKSGTLLRVGRVIVPIVKAIYERDMAIKNFVPEKYYTLISKAETNGTPVVLQSKLKFDRDKYSDAQAMAARYNAADAVVTSVKRKKDRLYPGKLYSLTKLQNVLGKKYKMSMHDSLAIVQKLYEEGYVTYPRTNSEYLATAEKDKIKKILSSVAKLGYPVEFKDNKTIFDDSKIESHSALTPTYKIPDKSKLSDDEMKVYATIMRRFAAVFCSKPCIADKTEIKIDVGGMEEFTLKGTVIVEPGWTKYDDCSLKDKVLPNLKKGDIVNTDFKPAEKETSPPKHYTIETLNNYLKNPFREEKAAKKENTEQQEETVGTDDSEEYKAIFEGLELGTEATRTGIIDNARKSGYILLKKDVYTILPDGIFLVEALSRMHIGMDKYKTAELGRSLKKVYRGEIRVEDSTMLARREIEEVFSGSQMISEDADDGFIGDTAGKCPLCGREVRRTKFGYGCSGYREGCKFAVSGVICQRVISLSNVRLLLSEGRTAKINNFISKNGKPFSAYLKLENGRAVFDFSD
ncbi:MAG: DNA topoisomerase [Oscillospiraceae bacterium]|nr:DNA topoisomerase [Oscillospiraceae bacterium]